MNSTSTPPSQPFDVWSAVGLVKDGSYAIVIFLVIVIWMGRKTAQDFVRKHMELMEALKDSNKSHQDSLEKLAEAFKEISKNNSYQTKLLSMFMKKTDKTDAD